MGLRIADIHDGDAAAGLERAEAEIARWEERGPDPDTRRVSTEAPRYYEVLADAYFRAGTLSHQQQRPREHVAHYLYFAAVRGIEELERRGDPGENTNRDFSLLLGRLMGVVACFGPAELRPRLGAIHESRYHWPHDPKWAFTPGSREVPRLLHSYYRVEYMRLARHALVTGRVDVARAQALIRELDGDDRNIAEREDASLGYWALMAIADRNSGFFDQTLNRILLRHRAAAESGPFRGRPEGLMAQNGMLLARLAREQGMAVRVQSDYLPLDLVG